VTPKARRHVPGPADQEPLEHLLGRLPADQIDRDGRQRRGAAHASPAAHERRHSLADQGKADTHRSSRPAGNMATAMRPALLGRALVRAAVCARPTHRNLGERFFRRMLDNPAGCAILSTSVYTNTTFVWRTCSHPDLPMPAYARRDIVDEDRVGVYLGVVRGAWRVVRATSSMKTVLAFSTASVAAFEERSSAAPTLTRGGIMATGRLGFSTGSGSIDRIG
jgi:hypothetical protein